uniref:Uncharacterized protein n=1 Tax=Ditylum brightwellii TaxID=49249 RepID=A0A6U3VAD6_9STRA|mmetsp:Transcript_2485/g.3318  ORF Transcript_2485/g.3318 Transcript_2485/m.3318 type:complete len:114 (-) Transcript_2485:393-734(-)
MSSFFTTSGFLLLLHSAYSCLHYRSLVASMDISATTSSSISTASPPHDVVVEVFVSFALCLVGQCLAVGPFLPVQSNKKKRELMAPLHRSRDFDIYNNRFNSLHNALSRRNEK